jgi:hypothetical protein
MRSDPATAERSIWRRFMGGLGKRTDGKQVTPGGISRGRKDQSR